MEPETAVLILLPLGLLAATCAFASVIVSQRRPASNIPNVLFPLAVILAVLALCFCGIRVHAGFAAAIDGASAPERRHIALTAGLADVLWAAAGASGVLAFLVPALAICGALIVRVRARHAASNAAIGALGIGGASITSGVLLVRQIQSLVAGFLSVGPTPPDQRAARFAELARPLSLPALEFVWALAFCAVVVATVSTSHDDALRPRHVGLAALVAVVGPIIAVGLSIAQSHLIPLTGQ